MAESNNVIAVQMEQLYALYSIQNILSQIYSNLALISEGAVGELIYVNNANLYQLAAKYYGDAMAWTVIAQANGLNDPFVISPNPNQAVALTIPPSAVSTGGILEI